MTHLTEARRKLGVRAHRIARLDRPVGASLARIAALVRKELRQIFRDPRTKRVVFAAPVIQLLLLGYAVNTDVRNAATFVVDHDRTPASRALVDALTAADYLRVVGRSDSPGDLVSALDAGRALVGLEIPSGFAADLAAGRPASIQVVVDGTSSNTATVVQGHVGRMVQRFGADAARAQGRLPEGGVDLRARVWYNPGLSSQVYNVPAVVGVLVMLMALLLTALAVVREREMGTLEQLLISPLRPGELMLGKTIPVALIAFLDLLLVCAVAILWFGIPLRGSVAALLLGSVAFIVASLGLGLLISTISRTQQEAFMAMYLLFLPAIILSGFMYPIQTMPDFFQALTWLNPLRYFLEVVRGVFLKGHGLADLWRQIAVLTVMAVLVLRLATVRFRRSIG
jgi:ABC-2 type transport system permease protein